MTKSGKKRKVWVGYVSKHWEATTGFSGNEFVLTTVLKTKKIDSSEIISFDQKIRIIVEKL